MSDGGTPLDCLGDALQGLWGQIEETSAQVRSLDQFARGMQPSMSSEEEASDMNEVPEDSRKSDHEKQLSEEQREKLRVGREERYIIELLERERIEAVVDLQKQDYLGSLLEDLIKKNDEIVSEVAGFFEKDKMEEKELDAMKSEQRQRHRTMGSVDRDIDANMAYLYSGMQEKEEDILEAMREIEANCDTQLTPEYSAKIEAIIKSMKKVPT